MNRPIARFAPERLKPLPALPVTLAEAKAYCRSEDADDAIVEGLISSAVETLDGPSGKLGRCLMPQTWRQPFAGFRDRLPLPVPAIEVSEVAYLDSDGAMQTIDPARYQLVDAAGLPYVARAKGYAWPATVEGDRASVFVTFMAGYETFPNPIKQAILLDVRRTYGALKADADLKKEVVEGVGSQERDVSGSLDGKIADIISRMLAPYSRLGLL
ncbi:MAG: hypothetical protein H6Q99_3741 [Proteobacteria bacterium]|nr:hypothetical protein [Pseudomonadota bacterium]